LVLVHVPDVDIEITQAGMSMSQGKAKASEVLEDARSMEGLGVTAILAIKAQLHEQGAGVVGIQRFGGLIFFHAVLGVGSDLGKAD
jgi:hypothetical protein